MLLETAHICSLWKLIEAHFKGNMTGDFEHCSVKQRFCLQSTFRQAEEKKSFDE